MNKEQKEILENAINTFGANNQLDMVIEECAELIQAINKMRRANLVLNNCIMPPHKDMSEDHCLIYGNLCSEVADVKITVNRYE